MLRPEFVPSRTVSAPTGAGAPTYSAWYEVAALVEVRVDEWDWRDQSWHHLAIPVRAGGADLGGAREFDPGRRSAQPGAPEGVDVASAPLEPELAVRVAQELLGRLHRVLFRQPELGLVSGLGESRNAFRRRCLAVLGPSLRKSAPAGDEDVRVVASLGASMEERRMDERELKVMVLRVGVAWYPEQTEPGFASPDLLVQGALRGETR